jgi:hypothetical protein
LLSQAHAQQGRPNGTDTDTTNSSHLPSVTEPVPQVPGLTLLLHGLNAGLSFAQVHNSSAGWYNVVTPAISYTFSPHYSADASVSIYPYRKVQQDPTPTNPALPDPPPINPAAQLAVDLGDVSDTLIGFHATFDPPFLRNTATASFNLPSGDRSSGLGTGRVTFDFSDHMEHCVRETGFILDLGAGDSSGLFNRQLNKENDSLGGLVHFQMGMVLYFLGSDHVQFLAYEQLPFGSQTLYTTVSPPGAPLEQVVTGSGVGEDNGLTTSLGIPLTDHLTLGGYYNRSLRQHLDTAAFGVTYVLRRTPRRKRLLLIDKALREAAAADRN